MTHKARFRDPVAILRDAIEYDAIPSILILSGGTNRGANETVKRLRRAIVAANGAEDAWGHPLCAECGRPGYRKNIPEGPSVTLIGHLDQRVKHSFQPADEA